MPSDIVLLAESADPLRITCTPIPCAGEAEVVLAKIELAESVVVPVR